MSKTEVTLRPEDTRSRIILTAARLVHAESSGSVGIKRICDLAGVHKGSFYHFFESKQMLMLAVVDLLWDRFKTRGLAACTDESLPPRRRIEAVFEYAYEVHAAEKRRTGHVLGCSLGNLAAEASTLDEEIRARLGRVFEEWAAILEIPLTEAYYRGEIDRSTPPEAAAREMVASFQGIMLLAKVENDPELILKYGRDMTTRYWGI